METGVYRPRNPRTTPLYQLIEDHFDEFCREYEQRYEYRDGALRPIVQETIDKYLNCGLLENGFCRVYCDECRKDFLVVFSMMMNAHFLHEETAQKIRQWKHNGFSVYQSFQVEATDDEDRERLTQYIARAPISNRKLTYDQEKDMVVYAAHTKHAMPDPAVNLKDEVFDPVEFIYRLQKHIPDKGELMIRYYGYYSNAS